MERREKLLRSIYEKKRTYLALNVFSTAASLLAAAAFFVLILVLFIDGDHFGVLKVILSAGVPFFAVGFFRRIIDAKRPYEIYSFYEKNPKRALFGLVSKEESGASFPSRHAYSAFVIATLVFFELPAVGAVLWVTGALMCVCRVLLGVNFVRDVLCGAAIGALAGVLGEFLIEL